MNDLDDKALVAQCKGGDTAAFEILVDRYQKVLYNVALRMLHNREDAMDASQTAFVKAYEKLDSYDPTYKFFSWIYKILVNESLNQIAHRKPQEELDSAIRAPGRTPEDEASEERVQDRVQAAIVQLPLEYRRLIVLRHFGDLTYRDMSLALDLPEKTVKSRLFTARRMLKDLLNQRGTVRA
jgi:RNA polymerase sigma-70 factor (ECF subfamily)